MDDRLVELLRHFKLGARVFQARLRNPLARALPEVVLIRLREMPTLDMTLRLLFREAAEQHCGRQAVLDRLIEVVFIQVLRDLMD